MAEDDATVAGDDDAVGVAEFHGWGRTERVVAGVVEMLALAKARWCQLPLGGGDQGGARRKASAKEGAALHRYQSM